MPKPIRPGILIFVSLAILCCQKNGSTVLDQNHSIKVQDRPQQLEGQEENPEQAFVLGEVLIKLKSDDDSLLYHPDPASKLETIYNKFGTPEIERSFLNMPSTEVSLSQHIQNTSSHFPQRTARGSGFTRTLPLLHRFYRLRFGPETEVANLVQELKNTGLFDSVQANFISTPQLLPNDPFYYSVNSWGQPGYDLWGLRKIGVEDAWDFTTGDPNIVIAVLDTGLDATHPDIQSNVHPSFSGNNDIVGHGTFMSGIIAATGNNNSGMTGVMWNAKILPYKVCDADPANPYLSRVECSDLLTANAIIDATDAGADVIYLSMSNDGCGVYCEYTGIVHSAIEYAYALGVVLVAPAGNDGSNASFYYPSAFPEVLSIGASDMIDHKSSFSNYGIELDFLAPGGGYDPLNTGPDILSLRAAGTDMLNNPNLIFQTNYYRSQGTSAAAAYATGIVGLLLSQDPTLTSEEIRQILRRSADDVLAPGWDEESSYGRVSAKAALQSLGNKPICEGVILSPENYALRDPINNDAVDLGAMLNVFGKVGGRDFYQFSVAIKRGYQLPDLNPAYGWAGIAVSNPNSPITGILGSKAMADLHEGGYTLRLTVQDASGHTCAQDYKYFLYFDATANVSFDDPTILGGMLGDTPDSLASGDMNGDAIDDLVMGSPFNNEHSYPGHVFLSYGNTPGLGQDVPIEDQGLVPVSWEESNYPAYGGDFGMFFGRDVVSLNMIPDFPNQIGDVVLAAPGHRLPFYRGLVCLYPGRSSSSWYNNMLFENIYTTTPPIADTYCFYGPEDFFVLGSDIENIGDINHDGMEDLAIVGCGSQFERGRNWGYVYIIEGGQLNYLSQYNNIESVADSIIYVQGDVPYDPEENPCFDSSTPYDPYGLSRVGVAGGSGDLNGDGYDDIIVNAGGKSYVFYGSYSGLPWQNYTEADEDASFDSWAGNFLGDINGDGFDDFYFSGPTIVYGDFFMGHHTLSSITNKVSFRNYDDAGYSSDGGYARKLGDINNDGLDDFAVGRVSYQGQFENTGIVWTICGNANGHKSGFFHEVADFYLKDDAYHDVPANFDKGEFGASLSSGDYNGDGNRDIAIGTDADSFHNQVYQFFGPFDCNPDPVDP